MTGVQTCALPICAADAASQLGVYMFNVHASGGLEMMQAAVEGARKGAEKYGTEIPKITAVTVLTSIDDLRYVRNALPIIEKLPMAPQYENARDELCNFPFLNAVNADIKIRREKNAEDKIKLQKEYLSRFEIPFDNLIKKLGLENLIPDSVLNFAQIAYSAGLDGIVCSEIGRASCRERV